MIEPVELDHISHSQLDMWRRCPRSWEFRYVRGIRSPASGPLILGGAYHKALEINFMQKIGTGKDLPTSECIEIYHDEWGTRVSEEDDIDWGHISPNAYEEQGAGLVEEYMETTAFAVHPLEVEKTYWTDIDGVRFTYRMDMRDVNKIVIDHKTAAKAYTQDRIDKDMQATAGAFVIGSSIVYHNHVAVKTRVPHIQIMKTYRLQADIDWWLEMTRLDIMQMKSGVAPPRIDHWLCSGKYCGYWDKCIGQLTKRTF